MVEILICDDSADYAQILEFKLNNALTEFNTDGRITVVHSFIELDELLGSTKYNPDIVFLDIMLGKSSSVDWCIKNIKNDTAQIIFMTEFPVEAYNISEVKHSYYLIKSRTTDEILKRALKKSIDFLAQKESSLIQVKVGCRNYTVRINDILYIESMNNNICLHLDNGNDIKVYSTLKDYSATLPPSFLRCHKCFVVNMNHIISNTSHEFILKSGESIPISPRKSKEIVSKYKKYIKL